MLIYQNERVGCISCIRGHRAADCLHYNKQLVSIKGQGKTARKNESLRLLFKPNPKILHEIEQPVEITNGRAKIGSKRRCIHLDPANKYEIWKVKTGKGFALIGPASDSDLSYNSFKVNIKKNHIQKQEAERFIPENGFDSGYSTLFHGGQVEQKAKWRPKAFNGSLFNSTPSTSPNSQQEAAETAKTPVEVPLFRFQHPQGVTKVEPDMQSQFNLSCTAPLSRFDNEDDHSKHIESGDQHRSASMDTFEGESDLTKRFSVDSLQPIQHEYDSIFGMDAPLFNPISSTSSDFLSRLNNSDMFDEEWGILGHESLSSPIIGLPLAATQPEAKQQEHQSNINGEGVPEASIYEEMLNMLTEPTEVKDDKW